MITREVGAGVAGRVVWERSTPFNVRAQECTNTHTHEPTHMHTHKHTLTTPADTQTHIHTHKHTHKQNKHTDS